MNKKLILYLVSFAAFFGPFTQTIYTPMLPEIEQQLQTSGFMVNLTISIFTMVLAFMQIIYGPLTDSKGRRKVLLIGIMIYVLASVGAAFSPSIYVLLFFRALQAAGIAAGSVVAVSVIGDLFEGKIRGRAMGTFQMLVALGPVLGPVIGGFIGDQYGFYGVFWVLTITSLALLLGNFFFLPETKPKSDSSNRFSLQHFSSILLKRTGVAIIFIGLVQYFTFYTFLVFLPDILSGIYGLTASQNGIVFLPMALFVVIGSFIGGRIQEHVESRKLLIWMTSLSVFSTFLFAATATFSLTFILISISLFGLFMGLSLPVQTTMLTNEFHQNRATAIGVYNFFRYLGMAAGPIIGEGLHQIGFRMEFIFAAVIFLGVVSFAAYQFSLENRKSSLRI